MAVPQEEFNNSYVVKTNRTSITLVPSLDPSHINERNTHTHKHTHTPTQTHTHTHDVS